MALKKVLLPWLREGSSLSGWRAFLFLAVVPILIGFLLGATRAGVALHFPWLIGVIFWVCSSLGVWACLFAGSTLARFTLQPWKPPLWLVAVTGAILGSFVGRHLVYATARALQGYMYEGRTPQSARPLELSAEFFAHYLQGWAGVYLTWVVAAMVFDRWLTAQSVTTSDTLETRSLSTPSEDGGKSLGLGLHSFEAVQVPPAVLDRLPQHIGRNVLALEAEDHYVRVHTDQGNTLLPARFSDMMLALHTLDGVRVHRSYWVRRSSVASVRQQGRGLELTLSNGMKVPVSHGYKELARQAGIGAGSR